MGVLNHGPFSRTQLSQPAQVAGVLRLRGHCVFRGRGLLAAVACFLKVCSSGRGVLSTFMNILLKFTMFNLYFENDN